MKMPMRSLTQLCMIVLVFFTSSCSNFDLRPKRPESKDILTELEEGSSENKTKPRRFQPPPPGVTAALLPDLAPQSVTKDKGKSLERRFDISVMQSDAREFFMALVVDSDYNVIVHPQVKGAITIDLKNVTLPEVLDAVREVYGYDFKKTEAGYIIYPAELMSRIFHIDYLNFIRSGRSETRVVGGHNAQQGSSGSSGTGTSGGTSGSSGTTGSTGSSGGTGGTTGGLSGGIIEEQVDCRATQSSRVTPARVGGIPVLTGSVIATSSTSHFWDELKQALGVIVCGAEGANFVVNQQSGVLIVRAFPKQLREVEQFLEAIRREVQRQVVLEAKILEVVLSDSYQAGVNWAKIVKAGAQTMLTSVAGPISAVAATKAVGDVFTVGFNVNGFDGFVELLETQGEVHTLSSPRIATMNNQKAVIKVGSDEIFVTGISSGQAAATTGGTPSSPTPSFSSLFSGIALDVTPQIDDGGKVTLHIHPSVTKVEDQIKTFNIGGNKQELPLAFSSVRESDSVVHAQNGQIVVIGGMMQNVEEVDRQGVAWLDKLPVIGPVFRRGKGNFRKSELVILLRPTVIDAQSDWDSTRNNILERAKQLEGDSRQDTLP